MLLSTLKQAQFVTAMNDNYASTTLSTMGHCKVPSTMPVQQDTCKAHLQQYKIMKITANNLYPLIEQPIHSNEAVFPIQSVQYSLL